MKKLISTLLLCALVLSSLSACGAFGSGDTASSAAQSGKTASTPATNTQYLRIPESDEFPTVDPQKNTEFYVVPMNIFDSLLICKTENGKGVLQPNLAKSWEISKDGLVYTFHLQQGVKFSNGNEFTASDVKYTIERMMNPKTQAVNTDFYSMIKGAMDMYNGKATSVSGVKVIDDYTVQITLEVPFSPFLANLATPSCSIFDEEATEAAGSKFGTDPSVTIGTGPFVLKSWVVNSKITLVKNPNYWKGAPKLDGIELIQVPDDDTQKLMYENGELDIVDLSSSASNLSYFLNNEKYKNNLVKGYEAGFYFYSFNLNMKPTDDVRVRKAIQMSIDRATILKQLYSDSGRVLNSFLPDGVLGSYDAAEIKYDPDAAKKLLAEAGYPNGCDLTIYQTTDNKDALAVNQIIQSMLGKVGIKANIKQIDDAAYTAQRKDGKMGMSRMAWWADYNDPDNFLYTFFSSKNAHIRSNNYADAAIQKKLDEARGEIDSDKRMAMYKDIDTSIVQKDAVVLPMYQMNHVVVIQDRVKGFEVPWNGWSDTYYYDTYLNQ